jgi:lipopolysaccharide export system protein LptA
VIRPIRASARVAFAALVLLSPAALPAETFTFSADRMSGGFAPGKESAVLVGSARVVSDGLEIRADRIELSGPDWRYVRCTGRVVAEDRGRGVRFISEDFFHDRVSKVSRMEGPSILEDRSNRLVVKGAWIQNDERTEVSEVRLGARILREDLACRAEFARYDRAAKLLELTGSPSVVKDGDEYRADRIVVNVETEEITLEGSVSGTVRVPAAADPASAGPSSAPAGDSP